MKKVVLLLLITGVFAACGESESKDKENKPACEHRSAKHSTAFNQSFGQMLGSYYRVKDALVEYDTVKANAASLDLAAHAAKLPVNAITKDSSGVTGQTADDYLATIKAAADGFKNEPDLEKKKKRFQAISDALYDLVRTVGYDDQKIYHQHCPMAFNDQDEAYWLSSSSKVVNPYLGKKHPKYRSGMVHCGEVTDSLGFSR